MKKSEWISIWRVGNGFVGSSDNVGADLCVRPSKGSSWKIHVVPFVP